VTRGVSASAAIALIPASHQYVVIVRNRRRPARAETPPERIRAIAPRATHMRTTVVVLGDLGRSPRMQYHAARLAARGEDVDLVGLAGTRVGQALTDHPRVTVHTLRDPARAREGHSRRRFVWASALRAVGQAWRLLGALRRMPRPDAILVQTPPAVPTLQVAWLVARLRRARLVVDWHNLAHTVLAVKVGPDHRAVRSLARMERRWGRRADAHVAVSRALADWLSREWGITATVLYDRPSAPFVRVSDDRWDEVRRKLHAELGLGVDALPLVVSPTSWSLDEDFDLLLEAVERAERRLADRGLPPAPAVAIVVTGKGPLRAAFEQRLARRALERVVVRTTWLESADYPALVGRADLGLCLHQSSSGLDLPMKVSDFMGAGVPVAAFDYAPVLGEVLREGQEGLLFRDPGTLARILVGLATGEGEEHVALVRSRAWLAANPVPRWEQEYRG
jgi:beta-1,4-mannosyltransferase